MDELYANLQASSRWRFSPSLSDDSREFLIADWEDVRPDVVRRFSRRGADETTVGELFTDYTLDAKPILLRAFISQILYVTRPEEEDMALASFRLGVGGEDEVAWCGQTSFPPDEPPEVDQLVEVRGIVVARGSVNTASGGFENGTHLVCSSVRQLGSAESSREVAGLFRTEEQSRLWKVSPTMSARARMYLLRNWDEMTPYKVHPFPEGETRVVGIDQIYEDTRFDHELLWISGWVTQRFLEPAGPGLTTEYVRLEVDGQDYAVWCQTTVENSRVFRENELLEAVGVPIARGSAELSSGGFDNETAMVCPAMRRA